jgi:F-type H+-transporting ATPase subunit delta
MSEPATLARPYAVAVFKRAKEMGRSAQWSDMLSFLGLALKDKTLSAAVANPALNSARLTELMMSIGADYLDEEGINFLKLLIKNGRLTLMPEIARIFEQLKADDEGYAEVEVLTAYPFTEESQQAFAAKLEKTFHKKIHMKVSVDQSLIGGIFVRAGDRVIDGSIRGRLQQLQKELQ